MPLTRIRGAEGEGEALGQAPQGIFADGVAREVRGEVPDPLVEQIDDQPLGRWILCPVILPRKGLGEDKGRAEVNRQMLIPFLARDGQSLVALEPRGIIDQQQRRERGRPPPDR